MFEGNLSVFFPAYNEEKNIGETIKKAAEVLKDLKLKKWEIIVVDDGSSDKTPQISDKLAQEFQNVRVIHQKNGGYGSALKTGFENSKYEWVAFTDSDGQFDFSEVKTFLERTDQADLVLGYRLNRADPIQRSIFTYGWKTLAKILLGLNVRDYSCGFKLIKKKVYDEVQPLEGEEKVTQMELLVKAARLGFKFADVPVHHYPRKYGNPTGANIKVVLKSVIDLFKLWGKLK